MFTPINTHVQDAIKRLVGQYADATNLKNLVTAFVTPIQDIEGVLNDMNVLRQLSIATGQQLDNIGKIVGLPRPPGDDDNTYRNKLYAAIKINTSEGEPERVIETYQLFTSALLVILFEGSSGDILLESEFLPSSQAEVDSLLLTLESVLPAGIRAAGLVAFDATEAFAYDGSLAGLGYGTDSDPGVGGKYPILFTHNGYFEYDGNDVKGLGYGSSDDPLVGGWYASV